MKVRVIHLLGAVILVAAAIGGTLGALLTGGGSGPLTKRTITFELTVPNYVQETRSQPDGEAVRIAIDGYQSDFLAGAPGLPRSGVLIGIPPNVVDIQLSVISTVSFTSGDQPEASAGANADAWTGPEILQIGEQGVLRNQPFVRVEVRPVQWNTETGQLNLHSRIEAQLTVTAQKESDRFQSDTSDDSPVFEEILKQSLLNYDEARRWRSKPLLPPNESDLATALSENPDAEVLKLTVGRQGVYIVTYDDLVAAGLLKTRTKPEDIRGFSPSSEIAIEVTAKDASAFGAGDYLKFFGQATKNKHGDENAYWIVLNAGAGQRVPVVEQDSSASPETSYRGTLRFEENFEYRPAFSAGIDDDHWYWEVLNASGNEPPSTELEFTLAAAPVADSESLLRANIIGLPAQDDFDTFSAGLSINGQAIGGIAWGGPVDHTGELLVPAGLLQRGDNTLRIEVPREPGDRPVVLPLNWFELETDSHLRPIDGELVFEGDAKAYELTGFQNGNISVYDITDPSAVRRAGNLSVGLAGLRYDAGFAAIAPGLRRYLVTTGDKVRQPLTMQPVTMQGLASSDNRADYLIITPTEFLLSVQPLAEYHQSLGRVVKVVAVEDIYNEFSAGLLRPEAIQSFLRYTAANWKRPAPSYVLLVGDGTWDFHDYLETGEKNFIPPFLAQVDRFLGEGTTDNRYAAVVGDDKLPDLLLGRLTARTAEEVDGMVSKILGYAFSGRGDWADRVSLVSDNPDQAGDFIGISESISAALPASTEVTRTYLTDPGTETEQVRSSVGDILNDGALIVSYVGHAGITQWGHENLLDNDGVAGVDNQGRLPLILSLTCYDGLFSAPQLTSLSENLVRNPEGGAIAAFASTGLSVATGHELLGTGFLNAVYDQQVLEMGAAALLAKINVFSSSSDFRDLLDTFGLLGDPGLSLKAR